MSPASPAASITSLRSWSSVSSFRSLSLSMMPSRGPLSRKRYERQSPEKRARRKLLYKSEEGDGSQEFADRISQEDIATLGQMSWRSISESFSLDLDNEERWKHVTMIEDDVSSICSEDLHLQKDYFETCIKFDDSFQDEEDLAKFGLPEFLEPGKKRLQYELAESLPVGKDKVSLILRAPDETQAYPVGSDLRDMIEIGFSKDVRQVKWLHDVAQSSPRASAVAPYEIFEPVSPILPPMNGRPAVSEAEEEITSLVNIPPAPFRIYGDEVDLIPANVMRHDTDFPPVLSAMDILPSFEVQRQPSVDITEPSKSKHGIERRTHKNFQLQTFDVYLYSEDFGARMNDPLWKTKFELNPALKKDSHARVTCDLGSMPTALEADPDLFYHSSDKDVWGACYQGKPRAVRPEKLKIPVNFSFQRPPVLSTAFSMQYPHWQEQRHPSELAPPEPIQPPPAGEIILPRATPREGRKDNQGGLEGATPSMAMRTGVPGVSTKSAVLSVSAPTYGTLDHRFLTSLLNTLSIKPSMMGEAAQPMAKGTLTHAEVEGRLTMELLPPEQSTVVHQAEGYKGADTIGTAIATWNGADKGQAVEVAQAIQEPLPPIHKELVAEVTVPEEQFLVPEPVTRPRRRVSTNVNYTEDGEPPRRRRRRRRPRGRPVQREVVAPTHQPLQPDDELPPPVLVEPPADSAVMAVTQTSSQRSRVWTDNEVKQLLQMKMMEFGQKLRFSDCCEPGKCSRNSAASFFSALLNLEAQCIVCLHQPDMSGDPNELVIEVLDNI